MDLDNEKLKKLTTVANEFEAAAIVNALEAEGIRAEPVGGYTADFRVELPSGVAVLVTEHDLERAKAILSELRAHGAGVDWDKVDVDQPEDEAE
jgi:Putative prokaryotic signal transducing protein